MSPVDFVADQSAAQAVQAKLIENRTELPSVHKFGGSSLQSASAINRVVDIIIANTQAKDLIILSAMGKTTDMLFELVNKTLSAGALADVCVIRAYQQQIITDLLPATTAKALIEELNADLQRIDFLLSHAESQETPFNPADVICYGELWSTRVVSSVLRARGVDCQRVDSRDFIYVADPLHDNGHCGIEDTVIDWQKSHQAFARWSEEFGGKLSVISGYIATDSQGDTTTLGRNGSDFSATIVAKLINAGMVYLWTDVNGVFSADPNRFNNTKVIPLLGLNEANALANLGTPVFHEKTLKPLQDANIPIRIRNSQQVQEQNSGTLILTQPVKWPGAKTIALKQSVCLFSIKWHDSSKHETLSQKLQQLLVGLQISNYCWLNENTTLNFCVAEQDQTQVAKLLTRKQVGEGCQFSVNKDLSIISLVGYELLQHGEHLAAFFSLLQQSQKGILLYHYDQNGAISAVVNDSHPVQLVSAIHSAIFANPNDDKGAVLQRSGIGLVLTGFGNIGKKLCDILSSRLSLINEKAKHQLRVVAISNSKHYIFEPAGIDLSRAAELLAASDKATKDIERDLQLLSDTQLAVIDVTSSPLVTQQYQTHFAQGRHIVSASKLGHTLPLAEFEQLSELSQSNNCRWLGNVTCGAGLPIQQSIEELCLAGDKIKVIEGVFSGTLSWLLNSYDGKGSFFDVVAKAKALGLTEPDPREDLSGQDVQRKLLILARTMGLKLDLAQIELTPLLPLDFLELSVQAYADSRDEIDAYMKEKWQQANGQGLKLCYSGELVFNDVAGKICLQEASVGLSFRDANDPLVNIAPADNIAVIRSQWHDINPLIIRGPGAGIEVTAAGIVSDLVKLAQ